MTPAALEWITRFRRELTIERNFSPHTDAAYARDLTTLVQYCDRAGIEQWNKLTTHDIRRFASRLHSSGLSPRSIQRRMSAVRSFYNFLIRESFPRLGKDGRLEHPSDPNLEGLRSNPGGDVRAPKAARKLPKTIDADQMARLLAIPDSDPFASRDRAIMELLYSSGLRLAELVALDADNDRLDLRQGEVTVTGKGSKTRTVPVGAKAREALREWLQARAQVAAPREKALFVGARGKRISRAVVGARLAA